MGRRQQAYYDSLLLHKTKGVVLATLRALNERHSVPFVEQLARAQSDLSSASGSTPAGARASASAGGSSSRHAARETGDAGAEYSFEQFVEHFDVDDKLVQRVVETMIKETALQAYLSLTQKAAERAPPADPLSADAPSSDEEEERALAAWRRRGSGSLTPEPPPASVARSLELEHLARARTTQRRLLTREPEVTIFSRDAPPRPSSTSSSPDSGGLRRAGAQRASLSRFIIRRDHSSSDLRSEAERDAARDATRDAARDTERTLSQSIAYESRRSWNDYLTSTLRQGDSSGSAAASAAASTREAADRAAERAARLAAPDVGISARLEAMRASVARLDAIAQRRRAALPTRLHAAADALLGPETQTAASASGDGSAGQQALSRMFGMDRQPRDAPAAAADAAAPAARPVPRTTAARADLDGRAAGFRSYAQVRRLRGEEAPQRRELEPPSIPSGFITPALIFRYPPGSLTGDVLWPVQSEQEARLREACRLGIAHYAKAADMSEEEALAFFDADFVRDMRYQRRYVMTLFTQATPEQRGEVGSRPGAWVSGDASYWRFALSDPAELGLMISWAWRHAVTLVEAGEGLPQQAHSFMDYQLALQDFQEWTRLRLCTPADSPDSEVSTLMLNAHFNFARAAEPGQDANYLRFGASGTSDAARTIAALPQRARQSVTEPALL